MLESDEIYRTDPSTPFDAFVRPEYVDREAQDDEYAPDIDYIIRPRSPKSCGFSQEYATNVLVLAYATGAIPDGCRGGLNVLFVKEPDSRCMAAAMGRGAVLLYDGTGDLDDVALFKHDEFEMSAEKGRLLYVGTVEDGLVLLAMAGTSHEAACDQLRASVKHVWTDLFPSEKWTKPSIVQMAAGMLSQSETDMLYQLDALSDDKHRKLSKFLRHRALPASCISDSVSVMSVEKLDATLVFLADCWSLVGKSGMRAEQNCFRPEMSMGEIFDGLGGTALLRAREQGVPEPDILSIR